MNAAVGLDCRGPASRRKSRRVAIAAPNHSVVPTRNAAGLLQESERLRLVTVSRTPTFGGPGGGEYEISCPFGSVMTGLRARHGLWIDALAPICSRYVQAMQTLGEMRQDPLAGGTGGGEGFIRCHPPRGVIVSLEVYQADNKWGSVGASPQLPRWVTHCRGRQPAAKTAID